MSSDPLLDGQPISLLKVVDLKRELDRFGLPKAGNKKDLFERLRDHLNSQEGGDAEAQAETNEAEAGSRPSTRSSASPKKAASPIKQVPAPAKSPTKTPPVNRFVAQYLQSQQASLEESKRSELLRATSTEKTIEATSEKADESEKIEEHAPEKSPEKIVEKSPEKVVKKSPAKVVEKSPVKEAPEPVAKRIPEIKPTPEVTPIVSEPTTVVTKADVLSALNFPRSERDEASSTVSNAGSESAPQTIADDVSLEEGKAEKPKEETVKAEPPKKASPIKTESPKKASPIKKQASASPSASSESKSSSENEEEAPKTVESKVKQQREEKALIVAPVDEPTGIELDYEEDEPIQAPAAISSKQEVKEEKPTVSPTQEPSTPTETAKKHRAIVFDLGEKTEKKPGESSAPKSTKTTVSIRPNVIAQPPKEASEYGTNSLGNVRVRPVSPSRREPTQYIHITQLKRPYVLARLQAVLRTFGEFGDEDFWIDDFRSNCMVKYDSVETATKARDEMHNIKWPDVLEAPMISADYTTEERFQRRRGEPSTRRKSSGGERSGFVIHVSNDRKSSMDDKGDEASVQSDGSRKRKASPRLQNNKPLEDLFKKTKARPHIYYLPLTDEQIAAKKQRIR